MIIPRLYKKEGFDEVSPPTLHIVILFNGVTVEMPNKLGVLLRDFGIVRGIEVLDLFVKGESKVVFGFEDLDLDGVCFPGLIVGEGKRELEVCVDRGDK